MKKIISLLLVSILILSLSACGSEPNVQSSTKAPDKNTSIENTNDTKDTFIGVWEFVGEIPSDSSRYLKQLKVYKGGSGERIIVDNSNTEEDIVLPCSWEIVDGVFNMIVSDFGETNKMGFILENGILTSVNDEYSFKKIKD